MKLIISAIVIAIGVALALLILWPIWALWCFVMPQIYPTGPTGLIQPGYWLFAAIWFLAGLLKQTIFKSAAEARA